MNENMKRFLRCLYNKDRDFYATEGRSASKIATFPLNEIGKDLGFTEAEAMQIVHRLKGLVKMASFTDVMLLSAGKDLVERSWLKQGLPWG